MFHLSSTLTPGSRLVRRAAVPSPGLFDIPGLDVSRTPAFVSSTMPGIITPTATPIIGLGSPVHLINNTNSSITTTDSNASMAPNFSSGLAGVNLEMDQEFVNLIWVSMVGVAFFIFLFRICQLYSAHIRHIYCLHASRTEQNYWTFNKSSWWPWLKREVIYAPLGKKRHNQEIQLSKAISYGTLPGRIHAFLLISYALSNVIYCLILPYGLDTPQIVAELRGRTGMLATVNMTPLVLMAGRNNPAILLLNISFDNFNLFHRWIGRIVIVEGACHVLAWHANYHKLYPSAGFSQQFAGNPFLISGLVAMLAMAFIFFQALSPVRHAFYEIFLNLHIALAFVAFLGIYIHLEVANLPALPYIRAVVLLWLLERIVRLLRIAHLNYRWREGITHVSVEALPAEACRLTFQLPTHITVRPGSHIYVYIPRISLWQSHPFSVAWTNVESEPPTGLLPEAEPLTGPEHSDDDSMKDVELQSKSSAQTRSTKTKLCLVVAARAGMTRQLYEQACKTGPLVLTGLIEGPYAGHDSLLSYGTIIMFAGGAGITHHLIQIRHLVARAQAHTVATRKIVLVWTIRDLGSLSWIKPWMNEILKMPGRQGVLSMEFYVTRPREPADYTSPNSTVQLYNRRCDPGKVLDRMLPVRVGAVMVTVCGPGAFADEVRAAVRSRLHIGCIDMNEESFTW